MKNKNILITGSEGLLGKSFVKFIKSKCKNIFCIDIKNIKRKNYFKCDITNEDEVKNTINQIAKKNTIDILINNASSNPIARKNMEAYKFTDYPLDEWKRNLNVDLIGNFLLSKYVLKIFEKKNKGKIINISSIYGIIGPDQSIYTKKKIKKYQGYKNLEYSVAKAGIIGLTKSLAAYYKGSKIEVICLVFGGVKNYQPDFFIKKYNSKNIANRMADLGEYNKYIEFYSSENSSYSSGAIVPIDGGVLGII
jgi:short-subunit dehydrogenase